jgi:hypothetical protein
MHAYKSLIDVGVDICGHNESARNIAETLLALPSDDEEYEPGGRSGMNANGTPLQFCISTRREGWAGRFIADPAFVIKDPVQRFQKSYQELQRLYSQTHTEGLKDFCEEMISFHLPPGRKDLSAYPDGVFWFGASLSVPGIAVYMDGRRGGNEAGWKRFAAWLGELMPDNTEAGALCAHIAACTNIMSIGFEGSNMQNLRVKVYWRLKQPMLLDDLQHPILADHSFKEFLYELLQEREIRLSGMVFSAGFHIASQTMFDAKVDVCGCSNCINADAATWHDTLRHFTGKYHLPAFPISNELQMKKCSVANFGYGLDIKGARRLNLYLNADGCGEA